MKRLAIIAASCWFLIAGTAQAKVNWGDLVGERWDVHESASLAHAVRAPYPRVLGGITKPESNGDRKAQSPTDDWGLWQINKKTWKDSGPWAGQTVGWIFDPINNAQQAKYVVTHHATGLYAWTTYSNGLVTEKGRPKPALVKELRAIIYRRNK